MLKKTWNIAPHRDIYINGVISEVLNLTSSEQKNPMHQELHKIDFTPALEIFLDILFPLDSYRIYRQKIHQSMILRAL